MRESDEILLESGDIGDQLLALRDELCVGPDAVTRARHLAAMDAATIGSIGSLTERRRHRRPRALVLAAAATVSVLGLTGGLAAAGSLPAVAQRQAARIAGAIGWEIPTGTARPTREPGVSTSTSVRTAGNGVHDGTRAPRPIGGDGSPTTGATAPPLPSASAPGSDAPGSSGDAPGHAGSTPGSDAPGSSGDAPGQTGSTPGSDPPGNSGNAPGHTGSGSDSEMPGKSGNAPGQVTSHGVRGESAPGQSGAARGQAGTPPAGSRRPALPDVSTQVPKLVRP